jgi:hypothetical protein
MNNREQLISYLEERIEEGEELGEDENDASWGYETGILLNRFQAKLALAALKGESPSIPESLTDDQYLAAVNAAHGAIEDSGKGAGANEQQVAIAQGLFANGWNAAWAALRRGRSDR